MEQTFSLMAPKNCYVHVHDNYSSQCSATFWWDGFILIWPLNSKTSQGGIDIIARVDSVRFSCQHNWYLPPNIFDLDFTSMNSLNKLYCKHQHISRTHGEAAPRVWQLKFWGKVFGRKSKYLKGGFLKKILYMYVHFLIKWM